ncbi:lysophospholipid acyltransferase family protein [Oceanibacterium hippocampi]|uniref:Phosphatidylinositol mannoside acyltransferase n=1 Tax=Oceanibacterium hippocampi TaxID=745714 RepID=A0A1Y5TXI8_9PROT|nr:lysophospholipid acyltransferase family protein [Oceanibacterium hippocampi]SLN76232.1 Phosphatidylinositol mannoside acyltransferase [Oceanibacterium hippocampi]
MARHLVGARLQRLAATRPRLQALLWRVDSAALSLFWLIARALPRKAACRFGAALFGLFGPLTRKSGHVRRNLSIALPGRSPRDIAATTRAVWANLGAVLAEMPHLTELGPGQIEIVNGELAQALAEAGKPAVFVLPHLGNWEVAALAAAMTGAPVNIAYTPQANPYLDRLAQRWRNAAGGNWIGTRGGARAIARALSKGEIVGMLTDLRIDDGEPVPFFGREAMTTTVPARLALRFDAPLVPLRIERQPDWRYRVVLSSPIEPDRSLGSDAAIALDMTRRVNLLFEEWIAAAPGHWLCAKRRWPRRR